MKRADYVSGVLLCWRTALVALALLWLSPVHARLSDRYEDQYWDVSGNSATSRKRAGSPGGGGRSYSATPNGPAFGGGKPTPFTPNKTQLNEIAKYKAWATPRNLAKGLMSPGSAALTLLGGTASAWLINEACVRLFGGVMTSTAGVEWEECNFITTDVQQWRIEGDPEWHGSAEAACYSITALSSFCPLDNCSVRSVTPLQCSWRRGSQNLDTAFVRRVSEQTVRDPDVPWKPVDEVGAEDKLTEKLTEICFDNVNQTYCVGVLQEIVESGGQVEVTDAPLEGPPSIDGGTSVTDTVNPDGSTTTSTVTKRYDCTYSGQTMTCKTVTTTQKSEGEETTTETKTEDDQRTQCEKEPKSLGCSGELDTPEVKVPTGTREIVFAPENLGLGSGTCPSDILWTDSLGSHAIAFGPICSAMSTVIRPLLLVTAALLAMFIVAPLGGKD